MGHFTHVVNKLDYPILVMIIHSRDKKDSYIVQPGKYAYLQTARGMVTVVVYKEHLGGQPGACRTLPSDISVMVTDQGAGKLAIRKTVYGEIFDEDKQDGKDWMDVPLD